jgi:hypothetical protein
MHGLPAPLAERCRRWAQCDFPAAKHGKHFLDALDMLGVGVLTEGRTWLPANT